MGNPAKNEGEGNKTADREYRQAATQHAQSDRAKQKAREAQEAVDGDEASELKEAEQTGKSRER